MKATVYKEKEVNDMWTAQVILWITNIIIGFIEFMIGLRILLKLIGANTVAPFVKWVYETSQPLLGPFQGMLPSATVPGTPGRFTIELSALFAFLVYAFLAYLIGEVPEYFTYRRTLYYPDEEEVDEPVRPRRRVVRR